MEIKGLGFIPLFLAFWCVAWISASYTLTIILGHVASPLVFISDTGKYFPEQIVFCIGFIGMSAATLGLTWLNYKFFFFHREAFGAHQPWIQKTLLTMAWSSCILTAIMALFSTKDYPMVHRVTAFTAFIFAGIYNLWQSILLYNVPGTTRVICHVRTTFSAMALACVFLFIGSRVLVYTHLCAGGCAAIGEAFSESIEWLILVFILLTYVTYYPIMQRLLLTLSWKTCSISLRMKIDDFGV